ncbi:hypothetical protein [Actinoplanes derwentensis]|nr:hypothetical protein [Actinoplanes derwentensis]
MADSKRPREDHHGGLGRAVRAQHVLGHVEDALDVSAGAALPWSRP